MNENYDILYQGKWLEMCKSGEYEFFHRHNKPKAVVVFGITTNNELIAVEQTRVPHACSVLEAPAGLVDAGETSKEAAIREMLEETGYGKGKIVKIIEDVTTSPGICTESLDVVLMKNLKKISLGGGLINENESIKVHLIPLNNIDKHLKHLSKYLKLDMKLLASLHYAKMMAE